MCALGFVAGYTFNKYTTIQLDFYGMLARAVRKFVIADCLTVYHVNASVLSCQSN